MEKTLRELLEPEKLSWLKWNEVYEQCVWNIIVSNEEELMNVFNESWMFNLPTPIHALVCQRLALITQDTKIKKEAISLVEVYCHSSETSHAKLGVN